MCIGKSDTPSEEERSSSAFHATDRKKCLGIGRAKVRSNFPPYGRIEKLKEVKRKNSKGLQPPPDCLPYIGENLSTQDLQKAREYQEKGEQSCSTQIQLTTLQKSFSGRQSPALIRIMVFSYSKENRSMATIRC